MGNMRPWPSAGLTTLRVRMACLTCLAFASLLACSESEARTVEKLTHDLGRIAPGYRTTLDLPLGTASSDMRLASIASSCGCLQARLFAQRKVVVAGQRLTSGTPLRLRLRFEPKNSKEGKAKETVQIAFDRDGPSGLSRSVDIEYVTDAKRSIFEDRRRLTIERVAPVQNLALVLPLTRPLAAGALEVQRVPWVSVVPPTPARGAIHEMELRLGPLITCGSYDAELRVRIDERSFERAVLRVHAKAPDGFGLSPAKLIVGVPLGGRLSYPVTLRGPDLQFASALVSWETGDSKLDHAQADTQSGSTNGNGGGLPKLELVESAGGDPGSVRLLFEVSPVEAGIFNGRATFRPHPRATFRLSLPYTVRVY